MTKFFIQLMLSVILGIGAAMGFNPKVRTDMHNTLLRADASMHETVSAAAPNTNKATANVSTAVSVKTKTDASSNGSTKADLNLKNDLKTKMKIGEASPVNVLPNLSVNHSLSNIAQTTLAVDGLGLDAGIKDKTKSTLTLDLGVGK